MRHRAEHEAEERGRAQQLGVGVAVARVAQRRVQRERRGVQARAEHEPVEARVFAQREAAAVGQFQVGPGTPGTE